MDLDKGSPETTLDPTSQWVALSKELDKLPASVEALQTVSQAKGHWAIQKEDAYSKESHLGPTKFGHFRGTPTRGTGWLDAKKLGRYNDISPDGTLHSKVIPEGTSITSPGS